MANNDFYQILGVAKNASDTEIKAAYRKKALEWHPDRNKTAGASEKFKEITEAYEVLSNPQKRQSYDQFGPSAFAQGFGGQGTHQQQGPFNYTYRTYGGGQNPFEGFEGFSDPFEIFEQFFGGGFGAGSSHGRSRARRAVYQLEISFDEAVHGVQKEVEINGQSMKIKVPAGVDDGSRVRFGDFDIVLSVRPDKTFKREGLDVYVDIEVDFTDAALGTNIKVPTIDGSVGLKVPAGTQPGTMIRLRSRGVKSPNSSHVGDQYVRLKITVPTKLSGDQKRLLEQLHDLNSKKRSGWF